MLQFSILTEIPEHSQLSIIRHHRDQTNVGEYFIIELSSELEEIQKYILMVFMEDNQVLTG